MESKTEQQLRDEIERLEAIPLPNDGEYDEIDDQIADLESRLFRIVWAKRSQPCQQ